MKLKVVNFSFNLKSIIETKVIPQENIQHDKINSTEHTPYHH